MSESLEVDALVEVKSFGGRAAAVVVEDRGAQVLIRYEVSGRRRLVSRNSVVTRRTTAPLPSFNELVSIAEEASVARFEQSGVRGSLERLMHTEILPSVPVIPGFEKVMNEANADLRVRAMLTAVPKPLKPVRSRVYLDFIREKGCCHCHAPGPSDPHHYGARGTGQKTDDFRCVPLCRRDHDHFHDHGTLPGMNKAATRVFLLAKQVDYLIEFHRKDTT